MRYARLDKVQAEIKTAGRNISKLRYADDTTSVAESEEELKSLLMKDKEDSEKTDLKLNMDNRLVPNWERSTSRLYIITLLILLICRVHNEKRWVG